MRTALLLALALTSAQPAMAAAAAGPNTPSGSAADTYLAVTDAYVAGAALSSSLADESEAALARDPNQPRIREQLISYYGAKRFSDPAAKEKRIQHLLWVFAHYPESEYAGSGGDHLLLTALDGQKAFAAGQKLWLTAVDAHGNDIRVLAHAANFLGIEDQTHAEMFLKKAQQTAPQDPALHAKLGELYLLQTITKDRGAKYAAASKALAEFEKAKTLTPSEDEQLQFMGELVRSSYMVDRLDKTKDYATLWMKKVPAGRWDFNNAQHYGHTALGLIALKSKDLKTAKNELALSADHAGSPQLNSFGPCMDLAAALMDQGQKDAVADYLEACGKFWKMGETKLAEWSKVVEAGNRPDFTGHFSF